MGWIAKWIQLKNQLVSQTTIQILWRPEEQTERRKKKKTEAKQGTEYSYLISVHMKKKKSQKKRKQLIEEREEIFERLMTENFPEKRERYKTFY